jgi:hypothetical protein
VTRWNQERCPPGLTHRAAVKESDRQRWQGARAAFRGGSGLLLIACVKLTRRKLARAAVRERDDGVLSALGASKLDYSRLTALKATFSVSSRFLGQNPEPVSYKLS